MDYVRIYEFPNQNAPIIAYTQQKPLPLSINEGSEYTISVEASPSPITRSPVKGVYLMDSGYLLEYKEQPPYDFKVLFTKEYFDTTDYVRPGKQGLVPNFKCGVHAFSVFVQDEMGNVAHTDALTTTVAAKEKSSPYGGAPKAVPGTLPMAEFDEGGQLVAYYDTTRGNAFKGKTRILNRPETDVDLSNGTLGGTAPFEWLNFTVDVKKAGQYKATLRYGTPLAGQKPILIFCDNIEIGQLQLSAHDRDKGWNIDQTTETTLTLPEGIHILRLLMLSGGFNANDLTLREVND